MPNDVAHRHAEFGANLLAFFLSLLVIESAAVHRDADHLRRAHQVGHHLVNFHQLRQRRQRNVFHAVGRRASRLVAHHHAVRSTAVKQPQRDGRVLRMGEAPLPFDEEHVVMLVGEDLLLDGAIDEVGHDAVDRHAVAFDHDAGLAAGDELGVVAAGLHRVREFDRRQHLADAAVLPDGVDAQALFANVEAVGDVVLVVLADVADRRAAFGGGRHEGGIARNEFVQSRDDVHPLVEGVEDNRLPRRRNAAARGSDADHQRVGALAVGELRDDGRVAADAEQFVGRPCRLACRRSGRRPLRDDNAERWRPFCR